MSVFLSIVFLMCFSLVNVYGCQGFADCKQQADQEDASAQFNLGVMYGNGEGVVQDYKEAAKWFRKAADQGITDAQFNLGLMYGSGDGVVQDYKEAVKWYRKAAEQGDAKSQNNLGVMYALGQGVMQDYVMAHMYSNIASANGYANAQKLRTEIAEKMTAEQIEKAQDMARKWMEEH